MIILASVRSDPLSQVNIALILLLRTWYCRAVQTHLPLARKTHDTGEECHLKAKMCLKAPARAKLS